MTVPMEKITKILPAFEDERGVITNILSGLTFSHLAVITAKAGSVRGNHWHPRDHQRMYLISGRYTAYATYAVEKGFPVTMTEVAPGDLCYCPPGIVHAYYFLEDSIFLSITDDGRESDRFEDHTLPVKLIGPNGEILL